MKKISGWRKILYFSLKEITWTTKFRLSQSKNILTVQFVFAQSLSLTVEKLIWSREVNRSTSLNQRQTKRLLIGTCSLIITHPSGTSTKPTKTETLIRGRTKANRRKKKEIKDLAPTTCNRKLSLRIWGQTLIFIKLNLKVNGCVIILLSSFICLGFHKDIEPFIMSRDCKSGILSPQVPKEIAQKRKKVRNKHNYPESMKLKQNSRASSIQWMLASKLYWALNR